MVASLTAAALCSCGQKTEKETPAGAETSKETQKAEEKKDGQEVTLKVYDSMAYGVEAYDEVIKKFEENHPGVKVEIQHAANDSNTLLQSRSIMSILMTGQRIRKL